jgi:hypothetical protein
MGGPLDRPSIDKTAGMLAQASQGAPSGPPAGQAPPEAGGVPEDMGTIGGDLEGSEQATPQEQGAYEKVVLAGQTALFENEKTKKLIVNQLKSGADNPAQAIADAVVTLMTQLDEKSGGQIPEAVILPAAGTMIEEVSELALAHGDLFDVDQNMMTEANQLMVLGVAEQYGMDPQEIQALVDSVPQEQKDSIVQSQGGIYG